MSKGIKKTNTKIVKKPKKSSSKKESKVKKRRYFSYHFFKRYRNAKSKKDNFSSKNFGSTKPTIIDLEEYLEQPKNLDNNMIGNIYLANNFELDLISYENICKVNSNKDFKSSS